MYLQHIYKKMAPVFGASCFLLSAVPMRSMQLPPVNRDTLKAALIGGVTVGAVAGAIWLVKNRNQNDVDSQVQNLKKLPRLSDFLVDATGMEKKKVDKYTGREYKDHAEHINARLCEFETYRVLVEERITQHAKDADSEPKFTSETRIDFVKNLIGFSKVKPYYQACLEQMWLIFNPSCPTKFDDITPEELNTLVKNTERAYKLEQEMREEFEKGREYQKTAMLEPYHRNFIEQVANILWAPTPVKFNELGLGALNRMETRIKELNTIALKVESQDGVQNEGALPNRQNMISGRASSPERIERMHKTKRKKDAGRSVLDSSSSEDERGESLRKIFTTPLNRISPTNTSPRRSQSPEKTTEIKNPATTPVQKVPSDGRREKTKEHRKKERSHPKVDKDDQSPLKNMTRTDSNSSDGLPFEPFEEKE
jgi:hypothetical protein